MKEATQDEMDFILNNYSEHIESFLGTNNIAVTFYADSEEYVDEIYGPEDSILSYDNFKVAFYQDYSFEERMIRDINFAKVDGKKFIKIVTPFTRSDSYDFIITRSDEIKDIVSILQKREAEGKENSVNFPIIGLDFTELQKNTIDFLLNEDFREYCRKKNIKLKRGLVLEGKPGTGKTLSIRWLKQEALKNDINVTHFKDIDSFLKNEDDYYSDTKNIFVFEDFDAALVDRNKTGEAPNQILAKVLNTLDGIDKIEDVVSIFTTNEIDVFDDAFLRPGRIDKVISYSLPNKDEIKQFFEAYIDEEREFHDSMIHLIQNVNANISYAVLKGICDEINIWKFSDSNINFDIVEKIIMEKIQRKQTPVGEMKSYIL